MDTYRAIKASELEPGMRWHAFGRGYMGRTVETVEAKCNCQGAGGYAVDPDTHEPLHYPVIEFTAGRGTVKTRAAFPPHWEVTISERIPVAS